jgi:hypothetical protein
MSYATLDLTGMDIDEVGREFAVLEADFGEGYSAGALVGSAGGTHHWVLESATLPDASGYGSLIGGVPRMQYYWNFFQARMAEGNGPFIIAFRGKNYHAKFKDHKISANKFTSDLFGGKGVELKQHRVSGFTYSSDGSIP